MYIDLYKDRMHPAELFGKQVLYSEQPIAREEVPEGWNCYDLSGTDRKPDQPLKLTDLAVVYRVGTVLSPQPLKKAISQFFCGHGICALLCMRAAHWEP